jgi:hypothetical protein
MKKLALGRRTFLRGVGSVALGLPMLEAMVDARPAHAQGTGGVKRYVVMTSGQSKGQDGNTEEFFAPSAVGALKGQAMRPALAGLTDLLDDFSVVSGLQIPSRGLDGYTALPTAGKIEATHDQTLSPLLAGKAASGGTYGANGPTSDYLVAQQIAGASAYKQLVYRVQLDEFNGHYAEISYAAANKPVNNSVADPAIAFQSLFGSFVPPTSGAAPDPAIARKNQRRQSVLDAVMKSAGDLSGRLGAADRQRLSDHLDQVRALEVRIAQLASGAAGATAQCATPGAPAGFTKGTSYNDEMKRAEVLVDLITMAFACDLSRVASLLVSFSMPMFRLPQHPIDIHEESHSGARVDFLASQVWHVSVFGRLLRGLKALKEGSGTVLDSTAVVFALEAGHGRDGQQGPASSAAAHSTDNMVVLVGGGAGGRIKRGQHIRPATLGAHPSGAAKPRHPASVLVSCMNAVGVTTTSLGDVSGNVPELLV